MVEGLGLGQRRLGWARDRREEGGDALTPLQGPALRARQGGRRAMPAPGSTVTGQLMRLT